jgi:outer membrane biosynthesis protein TonB
MSEQDASRRLRVLGALLAAFAIVPLIGAVNATLTKPVVVVYPLTVGSGMDAEAGASVAVLLAQKIGQAGDVIFKPYPPGTKRQDFQTAAAAIGADYYITGFLTPLGDEVSLVTQIVFVSSGTVVTSSTSLVKTYGDAGNQADYLHDAILHHAGRALAALDRPPTNDTPAPKPEKDEANLSGLFKHKKKTPATPTPEPTGPRPTTAPAPRRTQAPQSVAQAAPSTPRPTARPTARPTPRPAPTPSPAAAQVAAITAPTAVPLGNPVVRLKTGAAALVLDVAGDDDAALDGYARDAFVGALQRGGVAAESLPANPAELPKRAGEYCAAAFGAKTLYVPKLTIDRGSDGHANGVSLDVTSYDCAGNQTGRQQSHARAGRNLNAALDYVASATVSGFTFATR